MKRYKLLKDLPCAGAGEIFQQDFDENNIVYMFQKSYGIKQHKICLDYIDDFDEWFEEIEEPEEYFIIIFLHLRITKISTDFFAEWVIENLKSLGLLFKTEEEAEEYLEFLKAKEVIKQDTKGFKPNWNDTKQIKYSCFYDEDRFTGHRCVKPVIEKTSTKMGALIYFKSEEDIKESLEKHPEEWRTYLFYEQ